MVLLNFRKKNTIIFIYLLALCYTRVYAQESVTLQIVPEESDAIEMFQDDSPPPYFGLVSNEIHYAATQAGEIQVFNMSGEVLRTVQCPQVINSNLLYFSLMNSGRYICLSSTSLYSITGTGEINWRYRLQSAVHPEAVIINEGLVYIINSNEQGPRFTVVDLDTGGCTAVFSADYTMPIFSVSGENIPFLRVFQGNEYFLTCIQGGSYLYCNRANANLEILTQTGEVLDIPLDHSSYWLTLNNGNIYLAFRNQGAVVVNQYHLE